MKQARKLYPGHLVEVRSFDEIAATLDANGCLDNLPFMSEMVEFCGQRFTVRHRLEKTCVEGVGKEGLLNKDDVEGTATMRLLPHTVTLAGLYCNGSSHEGCQRTCPILWKEAWLKPLYPGENIQSATKERVTPHVSFRSKKDDTHYFCQSTELVNATKRLFPLGILRLTLEYRSRNVDLRTALRFIWLPFIIRVKTKLLGLAWVQPVGKTNRTPVEDLMLQPGEMVQVKSPQEIALTLDRIGRNRGLAFTPSMLPFCGREYRVKKRVDQGILEMTGEMHHFRATVILEGVTCDGHTYLGGCSRHSYHLWREIWLHRVSSTI